MNKKRETLINQRSNWLPRRYCKYAVTNNPAKVIGNTVDPPPKHIKKKLMGLLREDH